MRTSILENMKKSANANDIINKYVIVIPEHLKNKTIPADVLDEMIDEDVVDLLLFKSFYDDRYLLLRGAAAVNSMHLATKKDIDFRVKILYASKKELDAEAINKATRIAMEK